MTNSASSAPQTHLLYSYVMAPSAATNNLFYDGTTNVASFDQTLIYFIS